MPPPVDIVIPFYRHAELVAPLFASLSAAAAELAAASCAVVAVNDSPDDPALRSALAEACEALGKSVLCKLVVNQRNLGFVGSANQALRLGARAKHDVLLLNSDTVIFSGSVAELRRVAYLDPMIGFVSPRSNNATICTLPHPPEFRDLPPAAAYENFLSLARHLPDYHYVPTAVGFCLYIKHDVIEEFGEFDEIYGQGYNEENDLIMRANRAGYRAALANHAFVYHAGEASFSAPKKSALENRNAQILSKRYPEYAASVRRYQNGAHYRAEKALAAMLPDSDGRLDLVFDFSTVGAYHCGTFEAGKRILQCAAQAWARDFHIYAMVSQEARSFHKLDEMPGVFFVAPETRRTFAVAFRFAQPFAYEQLFRMSRTGVLNVYGMLDTIALDCEYLNNADLPVIWNAVIQHADGLVYISDFVRDQFHRRFRIGPNVKELVAYLSLDFRDYTEKAPAGGAGRYVLVIGNAFEHKRMPATVAALSRAFPREKIVALGFNSEARQNVVAYPSGNLSEKAVSNLIGGAKFVVFPSLYEGFGMPVVQSLAHSKPVLARSIPVIRSIREKIAARDNLILYDSTADLVGRLNAGFPSWLPYTTNGAEPQNWEAVADSIGQLLREAVRDWSMDRLIRRIEYLAVLRRAIANPTQEPAGAEPATALAADFGTELAGAAGPAENISDLAARLRDRELRVANLERSLSWRITAPLRSVGGAWLRMLQRKGTAR